MKSYYRYAPSQTIGVINAPECNSVFDFTGKLAFTGALQSVGVWNLRQGSQVRALSYEMPNYPYGQYGEVCVLARCPDKVSIVAGYTTGEVRVFNYVTGTLTATLRGHRSAVTAIAFDEDPAVAGSVLATGGADCDIIVWDLVSLTGTARFHEHKDAVTALGFVTHTAAAQKLLVSASKDALVKVWDTETRHCVQTIVGHRSEVWALAVLNDRSDASKIRIYTGAADEMIRGYRIVVGEDTTAKLDSSQEIFTYFGCVKRAAGLDRCLSLSVNAAKNVLAAQSSGKTVEFFRIRDAAEAKKKMKRRLKRVKAKDEKGNATATADKDDDDKESDDEKDAQPVTTDDSLPLTAQNDLLLSDEIESLSSLRCSARVRSFAFSPVHTQTQEDIALVALSNNSLEMYRVPHGGQGAHASTKASVLDLQGHRSDVRAVAVATEGNAIATCSSESVKMWSARSLASTGTVGVDGYCLSLCFVPGGRYVLCGTKDGKLHIFDLAAGEAVFTDETAHANSAIWSLAVRPDGRGFCSGSADKTVKFWSFSVQSSGISAQVERQLVLPSDVLCVRYNPTKASAQLLVAVALLDNTLRVFYEDSCKLFLTLYGHKLPVMCVDVSYDSQLLVSGSADKTIKLWGLDFGDCHRSLHAHDDSVTCVRFQPQTHFFFSAGKDGMVKYWDADRAEQILLLSGHKGAVWSLDLSFDGSQVFTAGQDRSVRVWARTEDLVFVEEEKERALDAQVDSSLDKEKQDAREGEVSVAALSSAESARGAELLMQAMDLVEEELALRAEQEALAASKKESEKDEEQKKKKARKEEANPLLLGLSPLQYLQRALRMIKGPDLEPALLVLPMHYVKRLLSLLVLLAKAGLDLELCCRCGVFLLLCHQKQISSTASLLPELLALKEVLGGSVHAYRELIGTNHAGLVFVQRALDQAADEKTALEDLVLRGDKIGNVADNVKKATAKAK